MAQKYYITRERDDLIVAVWTDAEHSNWPDNNEAMVGANSNRTHRSPLYSYLDLRDFRDDRHITLAHHDGDRFNIPWSLAKKWTVCEHLFQHVENKLTVGCFLVDEGNYKADVRIE